MSDFEKNVNAGVIRNVGEFCALDEQIYIYYNNTVTLTVQIMIRFLTQDGFVRYRTHSIICDTTGNPKFVTIPSVNGFIQSAIISTSSGTPTATSSYFEVGICKSNAGAISDANFVILRGYLQNKQNLSNGVFTIGQASALTSAFNTDQGVITLFDGGGVISFNMGPVTAGTVWVIKRMYIKAITSAVAGNRFLLIQERTSAGGTIRNEIISPVAQAANLTYDYSVGPGMSDWATAFGTVLPRVKVGMPESMILEAGEVLTFDMDNRQAGDQFSAARVVYQVITL